jgi:hypothetical protein
VEYECKKRAPAKGSLRKKMSVCYSPMLAHRTADGNIIFSDPKNIGISELKLPCGQCIGCRLNHAEGWALRMVHEAQCHEENAFITLTYSDENLPEKGNLNYEDVTKFIKKLRKLLNKTHYKIKYYRVGEYGENFSRPHYHLILFGFDFSAKLRYRGQENEYLHWRTKNGNKYFISSLLTNLWRLGHAEIGEVNYNTCMYVAKYVTKKVNGRNKESHYQRIDEFGEYIPVEPEKSSMSRRQAIGKQWLEKFSSDVYPEDTCIHDARRLKVPRYYDKWLEKNNPTLYDQVKQERENNTKQISQVDLTRTHEVKILAQKQFIRELEGDATPNAIDEKILKYNKDDSIRLHLQRKKNEKENVHCL